MIHPPKDNDAHKPGSESTFGSWFWSFVGTLGFSPTFRLDGRTYYVRKPGKRAVRLNADMTRARAAGGSLLRFRHRIRRVQQCVPPALLSYVITHSRDVFQLRLCIWLLGDSHKNVVPYVFALRNHESPQVRREVVRCLRRLTAWAELRELELSSLYEDTRHAAKQTSRSTFPNRMDKFLACLSTPETGDTKVDSRLVVDEQVDIATQHLPKDSWSIRRVLRRIRIMVSLSKRRRGRFLWPFVRATNEQTLDR